jgi:hypothetical protein
LENFPVFTRWKRLFWKFVSLVTSRDWFCQFSEEQGCIFFSNNMQSQQIYVPQGSWLTTNGNAFSSPKPHEGFTNQVPYELTSLDNFFVASCGYFTENFSTTLFCGSGFRLSVLEQTYTNCEGR